MVKKILHLKVTKNIIIYKFCPDLSLHNLPEVYLLSLILYFIEALINLITYNSKGLVYPKKAVILVRASLLFFSDLKSKNKKMGYKLNKTYHSSCKSINRIGPHNIEILSVVFGLLLGGSSAKNLSGEGVRITINQRVIHKDYLFNLYNFFLSRGYCSNLEPIKYSRSIKNINKNYSVYEFNTFTFRSFGWIYKSFYKRGKKKLPLNVAEYLNSLTLAI
jgi:hypothetical protein